MHQGRELHLNNVDDIERIIFILLFQKRDKSNIVANDEILTWKQMNLIIRDRFNIYMS